MKLLFYVITENVEMSNDKVKVFEKYNWINYTYLHKPKVTEHNRYKVTGIFIHTAA